MVQENAQLKAEIRWLKEQLGLAKHRLFAPSSEKSPTGQEALLFNEAEATAAPMPTTAFPNSLASPSAVAHILCRKFVEGSPLYRPQAALQRLGFELYRQTMANWMIAGAGWLDKLYARMTAHLRQRDIAHADETTLQVLKEEGRAAQTESFMWLYRSGRDGPPSVLFE